MIGTPLPRRRLVVAAAALLAFAGGPAWAQEAEEPTEPEETIEVESSPAAEGPDPLEAAQEVRTEANVEGQQSQQRVDKLSDEAETLFSQYSGALKQIDQLRVFNRQMRELIANQEAELASLNAQLERVASVGRSVTPLMLRMIDAVESFVDLDVPFLIQERRDRVEELRKMMARADVSNAEKYRQIMEAYQIENEYGRTIEAYRSTVDIEGREVTVDFLRFGRIALVYQSLDEAEAGVWDQETRSFEPLDSSWRSAIRQGLRIARKQAAPDLMRLPLPVPSVGGAT